MNISEAVDGESSGLGGNYRAEDLSREELQSLTVLSDREVGILAALDSAGQRLLIGPRGSGKSTYLKLAYFRALESSNTLAVYVNYSKSISLEPELRRTASAIPFFRQWLLSLIYRGVADAFEVIGCSLPTAYVEHVESANRLVSAVERRRIDQAPDTRFDLSNTIRFLQHCLEKVRRRRVILLLDDAAHAFAPEQQREFFEVFGALRGRTVSAKAAVYPGVTSYTPRFHVGHDAQLIDVWLRPESTDYLRMMKDIAERRLDAATWAALVRRDQLVEYLAFASFGIPRTYISMLSQMKESDAQLRSSKSLADDSIEEASDNAVKVFTSLESKLPRYRNFVAVGLEFVDAIVEAIRAHNERRAQVSSMRVSAISVQEPVPPEVLRIFGFLEYAGLVRQGATFNNGGRSYKVVHPHFALLISRGALAQGRNPSVGGTVSSLLKSDPPSRLRRSISSLLGADFLERCRLDLGACSSCGADRQSAEARFCPNCGARLEQVSVYEELLEAPIEVLPISAALMSRIRDDSDIRKIKHVILDEDRQALLKVKYIGSVRAGRIRGLAEEFLYE